MSLPSQGLLRGRTRRDSLIVLMSLATSRSWILILPAVLFVGILPLTHTIALRLLLLASAVVAAAYVWRSEGTPVVPARGALLVWTAMAIASLAWSVDVDYSRGEVVNEIGYAMAAFLSFFVLSRRESELRYVLLALVASVGLISLFAIFSYFVHDDWYIGKSIGVGDRNVFSTTITLIFPALMFILANGRLGVAPPPLIWLVLALGIVAGALTQNRIMWLAIGAATAVFLLANYSTQLQTARARSIAFCLAGLIISVSATQIVVINMIKRGEQSAADGIVAMVQRDERFHIWTYALKRANERPVFGHGFGRGILRQEFRSTLGNKLHWHTHNVFLGKAIELGLLGLAAYCALLIALGAAFGRLRRAPEPLVRSLGAFGLALLTCMIVRSLTDDAIVRENALLFWSLTGMVLGFGARKISGPGAGTHQTVS